jgi:hypothetical protein
MTTKEEEIDLAMKLGAVYTSPKSWAHRLKLRELQGENLTSAQRAMWRAALAEPAKEAPQ